MQFKPKINYKIKNIKLKTKQKTYKFILNRNKNMMKFKMKTLKI